MPDRSGRDFSAGPSPSLKPSLEGLANRPNTGPITSSTPIPSPYPANEALDYIEHLEAALETTQAKLQEAEEERDELRDELVKMERRLEQEQGPWVEEVLRQTEPGLRALEVRARSAEERERGLREALRPFAAFAAHLDGEWAAEDCLEAPDEVGTPIWRDHEEVETTLAKVDAVLRVKDFREARSFLARSGSLPDEEAGEMSDEKRFPATLSCDCGRVTASGPVTYLRCVDCDEDEWTPNFERITNEQVRAMDELLSLPWKSSHIDLDEPEDDRCPTCGQPVNPASSEEAG